MQKLLTLSITLIAAAGCQKSQDRVVVYCAQDREFAESIFAEFHKKTALTVAPKYDTEANKSVGLATELITDQPRPRADVHWNNEILTTIRLAKAGIYESYESSFALEYPDWTKPQGRTWQAFAARARVLIVNTDLLPDHAERPTSLLDLIDPRFRGRVAMAKPQFGTTATQAACLFEALGPDAARAFYRGLRANDVQIVAGNKQAATGVGSGRYAIGMTDSDDALIELHAGKPVAIIFPDAKGHTQHDRLGVLYIPNTIALVKDGPNPAGARRLIDALLRPETEQDLAEHGGFQIPLHPRTQAQLPPTLLTPSQVKPMRIDFEKAADRWDEVQAFLRDEFAR